MVCLDTSFLIDLFRGAKPAVQRMLELEADDEPVTVAAPTVMEFATGAYLAESPRERKQLRDFLASATVLPLDRDSAVLAGQINASLIKGGEAIGDMDVLIGAIATAHEERLVTRNAKHFSRIPGLAIEDSPGDRQRTS